MYDLSLVLNDCKAFLLLWKFRTCSRYFSKAAVNSAPITIAAFSYQLVSGIFLVIKSRSSDHVKVRKRAIRQSSRIMLHSEDQMCHSVDCKTIVITALSPRNKYLLTTHLLLCALTFVQVLPSRWQMFSLL